MTQLQTLKTDLNQTRIVSRNSDEINDDEILLKIERFSFTSGKKIFNLEGLSDKNAAELMFSHRYQKSNGRTEFLQHYLHHTPNLFQSLEYLTEYSA